MGSAIDKCQVCGEHAACNDDDVCGKCLTGRFGELGETLYGLGVESFEVCNGPQPGDFGGSYVALYGVIDHATGDIIGSGDTTSEALADAIETVRGWEAAS